jgi:hypothetical protein
MELLKRGLARLGRQDDHDAADAADTEGDDYE